MKNEKQFLFDEVDRGLADKHKSSGTTSIRCTKIKPSVEGRILCLGLGTGHQDVKKLVIKVPQDTVSLN